jgi:purine-nucleoside phosphorylase
MTLLRDVLPAAEVVRRRLGKCRPELAIVLGSGLSALTAELVEARSLAFEELPGFPPAGVAGHGGRVWTGTLYGRPVLVFQGRYHVYEGYDAYQVTAAVRLAKELGCRRMLLSNAAGGISSQFAPGHFMLVSDHLNLVGDNPLRGLTPAPFVDLCSLYRQEFHADLQRSLRGTGLVLHRGTLAWMSGPSYETPAEIRMLELLGAAAVSMSTVPEAIMAHALGMETVAISLIANVAAGKSAGPLSHEEVLAAGASAATALPLLLSHLLPRWE